MDRNSAGSAGTGQSSIHLWPLPFVRIWSTNLWIDDGAQVFRNLFAANFRFIIFNSFLYWECLKLFFFCVWCSHKEYWSSEAFWLWKHIIVQKELQTCWKIQPNVPLFPIRGSEGRCWLLYACANLLHKVRPTKQCCMYMGDVLPA